MKTPRGTDKRECRTMAARHVFCGRQHGQLSDVNTSLLPHVRGDVRNCFQSCDPAFLAIFDEELEEPLQYTVTVAMFFCAACRPVDFMYGFGHGVLNWGTGYDTNPRQQVFNTFNGLPDAAADCDQRRPPSDESTGRIVSDPRLIS